MSESENKPTKTLLHLLPHGPVDNFNDRTDMIGSSDAFLNLKQQLRQAENWDREPVLITGERGSGKDVAALALHYWSPRRRKRFVPVLIPSMSEDLLADELFGHKCHSFTGAVNTRLGKLTAADKGTIFLDEVSSMSLGAQAALLRILEKGEVSAIGEDLPRRINVRIVAATNESLPELIDQNKFREDLYDRLRVFEIQVPPLREREGDIALFASHFLRECGLHFGCALGKASCGECRIERKTDCAKPEFYAALETYDWPGNIRELRSQITHQRALFPKAVLDAANALPRRASSGRSGEAGDPAARNDRSLESLVRRHIQMVYKHCKFNLTATARLLGIPRTTLRNKIKKFGIQNR